MFHSICALQMGFLFVQEICLAKINHHSKCESTRQSGGRDRQRMRAVFEPDLIDLPVRPVDWMMAVLCL